MGIKRKKEGPLPLAKEEWQVLKRRGDHSGAVRSYRYMMLQKGVQVPLKEASEYVRRHD